MKLIKMLLTPSLVAISIVLGAASTAFATNWYVSSDASWDPDGLGKTKTTVKAAVTAASAGDTVWVQDGFVCSNETMKSEHSLNDRLYIDKAITLRSESGYVDEANGRGATIRGKYASEAAPCANSGAVRCIHLCAGATLFGFILEKGATSAYNHANYPSGGAIYGAGTVSNCVIRNCYGVTGGAIRTDGTTDLATCLHLENCVITNNHASGYGAAIGGRAVIRHCNISCNTTSSSEASGGNVRGGSNSARSLMYDCIVSNNVYTYSTETAPGGGLRWVNAFDSQICKNSIEGYGGGAAYCALSGCLISGNTAKSHGSSSNGSLGGGLYYCTATNCMITLNKTSGGGNSVGHGGGGYNCDFYNCQVISNTTKDCYYDDYRGGGGLYCTEAHVCYNTLFAGQTMSVKGVAAVSSSDATKKVLLVNCTIAGNSSPSAVGGCYNAVLVNSIVYGNKGSQYGGTTVATNSCAKGLTDTAKYPGCITTDPKFVGTGDCPYALAAKSPCRDKGFYDAADLTWGWVTDAADPRSVDLAGNPRLAGKGLDMGCYEYVLPGFLLLVR